MQKNVGGENRGAAQGALKWPKMTFCATYRCILTGLFLSLYITIRKNIFAKILQKRSFYATLTPHGLLPSSQHLIFAAQILITTRLHTNWGFSFIICNNYKTIFLVFVQIWQKLWISVILVPPGLPPFTQNLFFS